MTPEEQHTYDRKQAADRAGDVAFYGAFFAARRALKPGEPDPAPPWAAPQRRGALQELSDGLSDFGWTLITIMLIVGIVVWIGTA